MIYLSAHLPENYCQASAEMMVEPSHSIISSTICDNHNRKHQLATADFLFILLFQVLQRIPETLIVLINKKSSHSSVKRQDHVLNSKTKLSH